MLPWLALPLLAGLSTCASAGHSGDELEVSAEARPRVTVTLEDIVAVPGIQLQLQEAKRGKTSQFFGLMGKRVGGVPRSRPEPAGYQLRQVVWGLLRSGGLSTEEPSPGTEDEDLGSE